MSAPWFDAEELWMLYGLVFSEVEKRDQLAHEARFPNDPLNAIRETDAAAWRSLRARIRLRIEVENTKARGADISHEAPE